jgi:hypothetical protein
MERRSGERTFYKGFAIEQFTTYNRRTEEADGTRILISHSNLKSANLFVREHDHAKCLALGKIVADGLLTILVMSIQGVR